MQDDTIITGPLYASRKKVYPQATHGTFRTIKWALLVVTLGIYYLLPFLRWDRGPNAPGQAVLIDLDTNKKKLAAFINAASEGKYYRPMEAVSRQATIEAASGSLGEDSLLRALAMASSKRLFSA